MKRKQVIAFLLSIVMTAVTMIPVFGFSSDITGHWAEAAIVKWQNDGKIKGYKNGTFQPNNVITRAEFVRLLNFVTSAPLTSSMDINFSDIKKNDWFFDDISKAAGSGTINGFQDGTFRPNETVTRAQAAVFICNIKGLTLNETRANFFADASEIPAWAKGAVGAVANAGYLSGYTDGTFSANRGLTRAEAVSALDRLSDDTNKSLVPNQGISESYQIDNKDDEQKEIKKQDSHTVWTNGGGSSKKSSNKGSSSDNSYSQYQNIKISKQTEADKYAGKTLTGTTEIYLSDDIIFDNITFENVEVYAENTVKSAYIGDDGETKIASDYHTSELVIYFNGTTAVNDNLNVNKNDISDKVVIQVNTASEAKQIARVLSAKVFTVIRGIASVPTITAQAPVVIENGAEVNTIFAEDNASIKVGSDASVNNINIIGNIEDVTLNGSTLTNISVENGASVSTIEVNDNAKVDLKLEQGATIEKIVGSSSQTVKVVGMGTVNSQIGNVDITDSIGGDKTEVTLQNISATLKDATKTYIAGSSVPKEDIVVTATYSDGTTNEITNFTVSTIPISANGTASVTITSGNLTTSLTVVVVSGAIPTPDTLKTATGEVEFPFIFIVHPTYEGQFINHDSRVLLTGATVNRDVETGIKNDWTLTGSGCEAITKEVELSGENEKFIGIHFFPHLNQNKLKVGEYPYTLTIPAKDLTANPGYTIPSDGLKIPVNITVKELIPVTDLEITASSDKILAGGEAVTFTGKVIPDNATSPKLNWQAVARDADGRVVTKGFKFNNTTDTPSLTIKKGNTTIKKVIVTAETEGPEITYAKRSITFTVGEDGGISKAIPLSSYDLTDFRILSPIVGDNTEVIMRVPDVVTIDSVNWTKSGEEVNRIVDGEYYDAEIIVKPKQGYIFAGRWDFNSGTVTDEKWIIELRVQARAEGTFRISSGLENLNWFGHPSQFELQYEESKLPISSCAFLDDVDMSIGGKIKWEVIPIYVNPIYTWDVVPEPDEEGDSNSTDVPLLSKKVIDSINFYSEDGENLGKVIETEVPPFSNKEFLSESTQYYLSIPAAEKDVPSRVGVDIKATYTPYSGNPAYMLSDSKRIILINPEIKQYISYISLDHGDGIRAGFAPPSSALSEDHFYCTLTSVKWQKLDKNGTPMDGEVEKFIAGNKYQVTYEIKISDIYENIYFHYSPYAVFVKDLIFSDGKTEIEPHKDVNGEVNRITVIMKQTEPVPKNTLNNCGFYIYPPTSESDGEEVSFELYPYTATGNTPPICLETIGTPIWKVDTETKTISSEMTFKLSDADKVNYQFAYDRPQELFLPYDGINHYYRSELLNVTEDTIKIKYIYDLFWNQPQEDDDEDFNSLDLENQNQEKINEEEEIVGNDEEKTVIDETKTDDIESDIIDNDDSNENVDDDNNDENSNIVNDVDDDNDIKNGADDSDNDNIMNDVNINDENNIANDIDTNDDDNIANGIDTNDDDNIANDVQNNKNIDIDENSNVVNDAESDDSNIFDEDEILNKI